MRSAFVRSALLSLFAASLASPLTAQAGATQRPTATPSSIATPPAIDGRMDDGAWTGAQVLTDLVQREPMEGQPVSERTEIRILYDEEALYVGAWLFDSDPSAIVTGETLRDASLDNTDAFFLVLDTYRDQQNGFVFGTTPAGIEYDGQVANEGQGGGGGGGARRQQTGSAGSGGFNLNWDGSWEVATSTDGDGWYAEMRIPFSTLRYPESGAQTWGFNFARNIRRHNEQSVWAPIPRQFTLYRVSLSGTLSQFQAPAKRIVSFTPYVLGDALKDYAVPALVAAQNPDLLGWDSDGSFGGDAKIGVTQSLTLDLTVNTDFAQAEVDDQQVNLTRFPLFFPEKRAFFLENANTFSVGSSRSAELFFSRRIGLTSGNEVPIQGGARLTGKVGGMQVGLLNIQADHLDLFEDDDGDGTLDPVRAAPPTNFGVVRLFQELDNRTTFGGVLVSRLNTDDSDDYNLAFGLDGQVGIGQDLTFDAWVAGTATPGVTDGEYGVNAGGQYQTRDWEISTTYRQIGEEFNPEVGFLARSGYRHVNVRALRHVRFDNVSWFREMRPHISWREFWSLGGFSETRLVHIDSHFEFANGAFFQLPGFNITGEGIEDDFEIREGVVIPRGSYDNLDWQFRFNSNLGAPLSIQGGWDAGGFYNGRRIGPNATVRYRFQDSFSATFRADYFDVRVTDVAAVEQAFTTAVMALTGSYSFTPRIFVAGSLQYNDDTENLGANVRFAWLDTAGTGLYVVYNDTEHWGSFARTGIERGPQQRQFVIKYTKQFDFTR